MSRKTQNSMNHSSHHHTTASAVNPSHAYYDDNDSDSNPTTTSTSSRCFFGILYTLAQLLLFGSVIIFVYWIVQHEEGFAWSNHRGKQFNLHAVLMMTGFIFMNGQSMLIYKSFSCCKKIYNKIIHCIIFVCSVSAITIGIVAAIQGQHNVPKGAAAKHFYSVHSWIGITAVTLFALQVSMSPETSSSFSLISHSNIVNHNSNLSSNVLILFHLAATLISQSLLSNLLSLSLDSGSRLFFSGIQVFTLLLVILSFILRISFHVLLCPLTPILYSVCEFLFFIEFFMLLFILFFILLFIPHFFMIHTRQVANFSTHFFGSIAIFWQKQFLAF